MYLQPSYSSLIYSFYVFFKYFIFFLPFPITSLHPFSILIYFCTYSTYTCTSPASIFFMKESTYLTAYKEKNKTTTLCCLLDETVNRPALFLMIEKIKISWNGTTFKDRGPVVTFFLVWGHLSHSFCCFVCYLWCWQACLSSSSLLQRGWYVPVRPLISFTNSNPGSSNLHNTTCGMTKLKTVGLVDRTHRAVDAAAYSLCMCLWQLPGFGVACGESDCSALQGFFFRSPGTGKPGEHSCSTFINFRSWTWFICSKRWMLGLFVPKQSWVSHFVFLLHMAGGNKIYTAIACFNLLWLC